MRYEHWKPTPYDKERPERQDFRKEGKGEGQETNGSYPRKRLPGLTSLTLFIHVSTINFDENRARKV